MIWKIPQSKTGQSILHIHTPTKTIFIHSNNLLLRVILNIASFLFKTQPKRLLLFPLLQVFRDFLWHLFPIYSSILDKSIENNPSRWPLNPQYLGCLCQALSLVQHQSYQLHPLLHINRFTWTEILEYLFFLRAIFSRLNIEYNNCRIKPYNFYATYYGYQHFNLLKFALFLALLLIHASLLEMIRKCKFVSYFKKKLKITFQFFSCQYDFENDQQNYTRHSNGQNNTENNKFQYTKMDLSKNNNFEKQINLEYVD